MHLSVTGESRAAGRIRATESDIHRVTAGVSCTGAHRTPGQHKNCWCYPPQAPGRKTKAMHHLKAQQCRHRRCAGPMTFGSLCCFLLCCYPTPTYQSLVPKNFPPPSCPREKNAKSSVTYCPSTRFLSEMFQKKMPSIFFPHPFSK